MEPWSLSTLFIVFMGGIVGSALGALWAIIMVAFVITIGSLIVLSGGSDFILMTVGVGPVWGPHVGSFAAPIAAASYAVFVNKHPNKAAKDIISPLLNTSWDVLAVGGLFAILGHILLQIYAVIPGVNLSDVLALSVISTAFLARALFHKEPPWGRKESITEHGYFGTNNFSISWAGWQSPWKLCLIQGLALGAFSGAIAWGLGESLQPLVDNGAVAAGTAVVIQLMVPWSLAIISLIALMLGSGSAQLVPVWHAMAICGSLAFVYSGSIYVAALGGVLGAFSQELFARMFYNHGSSHLDPPAGGIAIGVFVLNILFKYII